MSERPVWEDDGTLRIPAFRLPLPGAMSPEARSVLAKRAKQPAVSARAAFEDGAAGEDQWMEAMQVFRTGMEGLHRRLLTRLERRYEADVETKVIGGVKVDLVTPRAGVVAHNEDRILLNLHGGAFVGGAEFCGLVESIPLACTARMRVGVVDYRQGWEHRFPAASEDVASVYATILNDYSPRSVGIFGYSAGGSLVSQAMAWFGRHDLPAPGALAICSAGAGGISGATGDSTYFAAVAMGDIPPPPPSSDESDAHLRFGYFAGTDPTDPLISPLRDPSLIAGFPPTLMLTGTRSFDLSAAIATHRALVNAGVTTELHAWEGMWHCFPYNVELPEAQDVLRTLTRFFERHLGEH